VENLTAYKEAHLLCADLGAGRVSAVAIPLLVIPPPFTLLAVIPFPFEEKGIGDPSLFYQLTIPEKGGLCGLRGC